MGEPLRRVVLDTDLAMGAPGSDVDDGFALALALADPTLQVDLVTTVAGNTDVGTATRLTRELLGVLGRDDVRVVGGAPDSVSGAEAIAAHVLEAPGEVTVVAIGPLTNVARALTLSRAVASAVREVVVMGGVFLAQTNVAAMPGEFNFWCDPEAAQHVLSSGVPLRLVGLDVTREVRLTRDDARTLDGGGRFGQLAARHATAWMDHQELVKPREAIEQGSCAMHDPLAVAAVTRPELLTWQDAHVAVETTSVLTRGVAVADLLMWEDPPTPNCRIATGVDAIAFRRLFLRLLAEAP